MSGFEAQRDASAPIGYLGAPNDDHAANFAQLMASAGRQVCSLTDACSQGLYRQAPKARLSLPFIRNRYRRVRDQLWGVSDRLHLEHILGRIDSSGLRSIVAFWGTKPMADIIAIKRN